MGMFDFVDHPSILCPLCKDERGRLWNGVDGWQTKDGECLLETLDFEALPEVIEEFYTACNAREHGEPGDHWIEARRVEGVWRWFVAADYCTDDYVEFTPVISSGRPLRCGCGWPAVRLGHSWACSRTGTFLHDCAPRRAARPSVRVPSEWVNNAAHRAHVMGLRRLAHERMEGW